MNFKYERPLQLADGKVLNDEGKTAAFVPCLKWIDVKGGRNADTAEVDARGKLFAAAPELLAMVERLVYHCGTGAWAGAANRAIITEDLDAAERLIAKVKGTP